MKHKLGFLLICFSAAVLFISCSKNDSVELKAETSSRNNEVIPVEVYAVKEVLWVEEITSYGTIKPQDKVEIFSKMPGKLLSLLAKEGQTIKADEVVAIVDRDEVGAAFKAVEVKATTAGKVETLFLKEGSRVSPMTPILSIAKQEGLKLVITPFETDFAKIRAGQKVIITLDALPNREFTGKVTLIKSTLDSRSGKGEVEITFDKNFSEIRPGMFARTKIIVGKRNALTIPPEALKKIEGKQAVYIVKEDAARLVFITVGAQKVDALEVTKGIKRDDTVITFASDELKDGSQIKIVGGIQP
ncbi:MAG: efflux RND transporter periplasmic adaptor subunit [Bacteroidota bacterium]